MTRPNLASARRSESNARKKRKRCTPKKRADCTPSDRSLSNRLKNNQHTGLLMDAPLFVRKQLEEEKIPLLFLSREKATAQLIPYKWFVTLLYPFYTTRHLSSASHGFCSFVIQRGKIESDYDRLTKERQKLEEQRSKEKEDR